MHNIKFVSEVTSGELRVFYHIYDHNDNLIGSAEGDLNEYGELVTVIKINEKYQKKGIGFTAFKYVFDELNLRIPITKIVGSWHADAEFSYCEDGMSTNLKILLDCIDRTNNPETCALATPTGKWASNLGFTTCKILSITAQSARVEFIK